MNRKMWCWLLAIMCAFPAMAQTGLTREWLIEVAKGNIPGHSVMNKFGDNPDIDIASNFEAIWDTGGIYVAPTTARIHDVVSTLAADAGTTVSSGTATGGSLIQLVDSSGTFETDSVAVGDLVLNDTNVEIGIVTVIDTEVRITMGAGMKSPSTLLMGGEAGDYAETSEAFASGDTYRIVRDASTGVAMIHILGLDASNLAQEEFVVMNGQTDVVTANTYTQQHRGRVFGSAATAAEGTITSTAQTDGTITLQVTNGNNQTLMAVYTVAENQTGYVIDWWARSSAIAASSTSVIRLWRGTLGGVNYVVQTGALNEGGTSAFRHEYKLPTTVPGGSSIWIDGDTTVNDTGLAAGFTLLLVDNGF